MIVKEPPAWNVLRNKSLATRHSEYFKYFCHLTADTTLTKRVVLRIAGGGGGGVSNTDILLMR